MTKLFWINGPWKGRLAISARPRGGDWLQDELSDWKKIGVSDVVSLLTPTENAGFDLGGEESACQAAGIRFVSFPIEDREIPHNSTGSTALFSQIDARLSFGANVVIHCRQGVGRAGMIAAGLLIVHGLDPEHAIREATAARGVPVPETDEQRQWIRALASAGAREAPAVPSHR
jgi:protein-tyrosine phosphatase